jgi:hypothetical protein
LAKVELRRCDLDDFLDEGGPQTSLLSKPDTDHDHKNDANRPEIPIIEVSMKRMPSARSKLLTVAIECPTWWVSGSTTS